jgi:hypothetical protein
MTEQMIEAAMKAMREEQRVNQNLELGFDDDVYDLAVLTIAAIEPFIEGALKDRIEALTAENVLYRQALRLLRDLPIVENNNANTLHLDGATHTGPVVDWLFHFVRKIKEVSEAALEKQP